MVGMKSHALALRSGVFVSLVAAFVAVGCGSSAAPVSANLTAPDVRTAAPDSGNQSGHDSENIVRPKFEPYAGSFTLDVSADPSSHGARLPKDASGKMELDKDSHFTFEIDVEGHKLSESGLWFDDRHFEVKKATLDGKPMDASQGVIPRGNGYDIDLEGPYMSGLLRRNPGTLLTWKRVGKRIETPGGR
jgi:hypothetical protein